MEDADEDSCSVVESFISPFFLSHQPDAATAHYRPARLPASTTHSTYRTVATVPSYDRYTHRQRFLHDNAFEHSFDHVIGGSSSSPATATATAGRQQHYERSSDVYGHTRRLYEASGAEGGCRAHLPGGSEHLLGKWKPVTRNGNELFDSIVQNSKHHQPTFA